MIVISVIVGSTRECHFSEKPAKWILQHLKKREGVDSRLLDLRDFPIPFFDQPATPARRVARLTRTRSDSNRVRSIQTTGQSPALAMGFKAPSRYPLPKNRTAL
jgi:NAD(P)H-dependent FMN reductase